MNKANVCLGQGMGYNCYFQKIMGNENMTTSSSLQSVENVELAHLGPVTLMQKDRQYCLLKTFSYSDHFLMEDRFRKLKTRSNKLNNSNSVLNVYQVTKTERKQICANNFQLLTYVEKYDETLAEAIGKRLTSRKNYTEDELYTFLSKVVESLLYIQDNGLKNIHLDSESILLCGEHIKVLDSGLAFSKSYLNLLEHYEKEQKSEESVYLAPELLKDIQELNYDPYISPKADIFSLGMILMEMVALQSMQCYYDYSKTSIDYDSLIHRLSRINHSLSLKTLIAEMLQFDPEERIGLVSLKEKVQRLRVPEQGIVRSRSSKMLQQLLSHSRKNSSMSRQSEQGGSLSRQPSSEKKAPGRIQLRCSAKRHLNSNRSDVEQMAPLLTTRPDNIQAEYNEASQTNLKNLVKNKLKSGKDKENLPSKLIKPFRKDLSILPQPSNIAQVRNFFDNSHNNNIFNSSLRNNNKFDDSLHEKQNSKGVRSTLNKLVEQSGVKKLLKLEQLQITSSAKNMIQSHKNTSRFGNSEKQISSRGRKSKPSDIYIQEYDQDKIKIEEFDAQPVRTLQKVMTFNKDLLINARSVENSIQDGLSGGKYKGGSMEKESKDTSNIDSEEKIITIKDVPVVISQEKTYLGVTPPPHFGKLQRQLNLLECIESIHQGSSIDSSFNTSNVIQSFRPRDEDYSSVRHNAFSSITSQPFKKPKSKKPHLTLHLNQDEQITSSVPKVTQYVKPSIDQYKSTKSIERFSNFTSISPPQDNKDSRVEEYIYSSPHQEEFSNKIYLDNGDSYEGELNEGLPHGNGVIYRDGKTYYSGSLKQGQLSGYGTLFNPEFTPDLVDFRTIDLSQRYWNRFQGEFEQGQMNGFGTIFFSEGEKFSGCLKRGTIQGYGCFYKKTGELISGLWSQNKFRKV